MGDFLDEIHQDIVEFAERHIEDETKRGEFIDDFMESRGYVRVSQWGPPAKSPSRPGGSGQKKSYFGKK